MAKRKQRRSKGSGKTDEAISGPVGTARLEQPWASAPTRNPRYVLYCYNHLNERQYVINSYALYAIRKIFDALVGDNDIEPSPLDPDHTMCFGEIDIKSDQMQAILDHQYSAAEEAWELPAPYPGQVEGFLQGGRLRRVFEGDRAPSPQAHKNEKESFRAERKPKIDRSKFITVQSLAEEIGIDPRDARAALRKAKVEKPDGGWLGDEAWAKGIRDILSAAKKALDKRGKK